MAKLKSSFLTTFERIKLKEIAQLAKEDVNPLTVTMAKSNTFYDFTKDDILHYFETVNQPFAVTIKS